MVDYCADSAARHELPLEVLEVREWVTEVVLMEAACDDLQLSTN
jgi:hypothetical protein